MGRGGVEFEWDEAKRESNIGKHGIDFYRILDLFDGRPVQRIDHERAGELRTLTVGMVGDVAYAVVSTRRGGKIRVISARRASQNERRAYRELHG
jgi:uncharacterized protein